MAQTVIKAEHLSKYYRLGVINNGTLFRDIQTWIALKRGKEDPHSKIGEHKYDGTADGFWALKDLNFEINQGDRVGIIGKNGAGKSTLLKILSRITAPTEGVVKLRGRVASLLEVGTGFHAELTGRENIYLNGAILGMKKKEVDRKLDEIIAFSEIEQHIDTPVKRYSSGMYVRLAFAVAAHLDSEILIADEVLAVGDAAFQKKALGKMNDLSTGQGRTVLFVSHQMNAVKNLCNKGIILEKGRIIRTDDDINDSVSWYLNGGAEDNSRKTFWKNDGTFYNKYFTLNSFCIRNKVTLACSDTLNCNTDYEFVVNYTIEEYSPVCCFWLKFAINEDLRDIQFYHSTNEHLELKTGTHEVTIPIPKGFILPESKYIITFGAALENSMYIYKPADHDITIKFATEPYK